MPKRTDLRRILVIGSGPIVIGQAAEFDYAGTQACLALREEGYEVILVNSNPATIMTDTHIAESVHGTPHPGIRRQDPALRASGRHFAGAGRADGPEPGHAAFPQGVMDECQVEILGTSFNSIEMAEDREKFKELCQSLGEPCAPPNRQHPFGGHGRGAGDRLPGGAPARLHAGRHGRRLRRRRKRTGPLMENALRLSPCTRCW